MRREIVLIMQEAVLTCQGARFVNSERQRNAAAQKLLSQLSGQYTEQRWSSIEAYLHLRSAELQASLDMPREQLLSTLALVRAGVATGGQTWNLDELLDDSTDRAEQSVALATRLMEDVHNLSSALTKGDRRSSSSDPSDFVS